MFKVDISKDAIWDHYLDSYAPGTNNMFKERREYDCQCCKQFIRNVGNIVAIVNGKAESIWDVPAKGDFKVVAEAMNQFVTTAKISREFLHVEKKFGEHQTTQLLEDGSKVNWNHFNCVLPSKFVHGDAATKLSESSALYQVFSRGLRELTVDSIEDVLELIVQKSIYKGDEFKAVLQQFLTIKTHYETLESDRAKELYVWSNIDSPVARIRNNAIGTLLQDLSEGKSLNSSVASFEKKVAPENYKRNSAPVTQGMVKKAVTTIGELGLESALKRRYATIHDVSINNVLFADRAISPLMKDSLTDILMKETKASTKSFDKVEEIAIEDFIKDILPNIESMEVMVGNRHTSNLVSLVAPEDTDSTKLFQWNNDFSWSYNGDVTDSMRERVAELGGRVDGVLRFTHSWNHNGDNQSLMDLHVFLPTSGYKPIVGKDIHDNYPQGQRVGWNNRTDSKSQGVQDVDFVNAPGNTVPLENITFPSMDLLPEGEYVFKIHNWNARPPCKSGFKAEIEFGNEIYQYERKTAMVNKEWITVAKAQLKNGQFTIEHCMPCGSQPIDIWGIKTEKFHKVSSMMLSPNFWDEQTIGNKHYMFMLDGCANPDSTRGMYNEFLRSDLHEHRKVFEVLANKFTCPHTEEQLSGVGFNSTTRAELVCKVKGNFTRTLKIKF